MLKTLKTKFIKWAYTVPPPMATKEWDHLQALMRNNNPIPDVWVEKADSVLSSIKAPRWMYILEAKQEAFFAERSGNK